MREIKISVIFKEEESDFEKINDDMDNFLQDVKDVLEEGIEFPYGIKIQYEGNKEI